jgi:hypothetical protein
LRAFSHPTAASICAGLLEHDPEKWIPVFGKDHAAIKG